MYINYVAAVSVSAFQGSGTDPWKTVAPGESNTYLCINYGAALMLWGEQRDE